MLCVPARTTLLISYNHINLDLAERDLVQPPAPSLSLSTEAAKYLITITVLCCNVKVIVKESKIITYLLCLIRLSQEMHKKEKKIGRQSQTHSIPSRLL